MIYVRHVLLLPEEGAILLKGLLFDIERKLVLKNIYVQYTVQLLRCHDDVSRPMCPRIKSLGCSLPWTIRLWNDVPRTTHPLDDASLGCPAFDRCVPTLDRIELLVVISLQQL